MVMNAISQRTSRFTAQERNLTLHQLEQLGLVSSATAPLKAHQGGRPGGGRLMYWLTDAGKEWTAAARARGEIRDKSLGKAKR